MQRYKGHRTYMYEYFKDLTMKTRVEELKSYETARARRHLPRNVIPVCPRVLMMQVYRV